MPIINVQMIAGRPTETRKDFAHAVTQLAVEKLGVPQASVRVIITEIPAENWTVGGTPKDEM